MIKCYQKPDLKEAINGLKTRFFRKAFLSTRTLFRKKENIYKKV